MKKNTIRFILDAALTAMIIVEMFIQYTGELLHEIIGFAFFTTIIVHLVLSAKWIKSTAGKAAGGNISTRRALLSLMGIFLTINIAVLATSSVVISGILSDAGFIWAFGSYGTWKTIHAVSSYTLCALVAVHLGMHWTFIASTLKIKFTPNRRKTIRTGVNVVTTAAAFMLGAMSIKEAIPISYMFENGNQVQISDAGSSSSSSAAGNTIAAGGTSPSTADPSSTRKTKGKTSGSNASGTSSSKDSSSVASNTGSSSTESSISSADDSDNTSSDNPGFCPLCRKHCPLSSPQCDKPFSSGLL